LLNDLNSQTGRHETTYAFGLAFSREDRHPAVDALDYTTGNPPSGVRALRSRLRPVDANNARFIPEDVAHSVFAKPPRGRDLLH
ncbi:MAG TPA: hypothetical protein VK789_33725, partial [Bryobacteraceae bacterium]|nr:hypothetical protein [Bryobacteraceae bacterium]